VRDIEYTLAPLHLAACSPIYSRLQALDIQGRNSVRAVGGKVCFLPTYWPRMLKPGILARTRATRI
jgi:hypothetical protein